MHQALSHRIVFGAVPIAPNTFYTPSDPVCVLLKFLRRYYCEPNGLARVKSVIQVSAQCYTRSSSDTLYHFTTNFMVCAQINSSFFLFILSGVHY